MEITLICLLCLALLPAFGLIVSTRAPPTEPETTTDEPGGICSLTLWVNKNNMTGRTLSVREGATVILTCEDVCARGRVGYPPRLEWMGPGFIHLREGSRDSPRIFTIDSGRLLSLYIQAVSQDDLGTYMCRGNKFGHWTTAVVALNMETQAEEFPNFYAP